ncbi:MAG TPA: hypothetical protein VGQ20_06195 [Acidimicrobiales bacterium]|jgi:hypothetical protein|nr:hypothetical protein [Acidimicrobiales bacterium]
MTIGRPRFRTVFWLFAATATVAVWWAGIDAFEGSSRRADSHFFWDGSSAAIMFGMAIIGQLAAAVTGGLLGTRWPWRTLGVVALAPFGALVATFAVLSATGGRCPNDGGACTVCYSSAMAASS